MRHPHHFKISVALALSAGAWGIYWLPQRILEEGWFNRRMGNNCTNDNWSSSIITIFNMEKN